MRFSDYGKIYLVTDELQIGIFIKCSQISEAELFTIEQKFTADSATAVDP